MRSSGVVSLLLAVLLVACGGGAQGPVTDGPSATFTATNAGYTVATDGFVYDAVATLPVLLVNEREEPATISVALPGADAVIEEEVPAGGTVEVEATFDEAGTYEIEVTPETAGNGSGISSDIGYEVGGG